MPDTVRLIISRQGLWLATTPKVSPVRLGELTGMLNTRWMCGLPMTLPCWRLDGAGRRDDLKRKRRRRCMSISRENHLEECASRQQALVSGKTTVPQGPYTRNSPMTSRATALRAHEGQTLAFVRIQHANGVNCTGLCLCQACPAFRVCTRRRLGLAIVPHDFAVRTWMSHLSRNRRTS